MSKNSKTTLEKLEGLVNIVAVNVAEIKSEVVDIKSKMATKKDLEAFAKKTDLEAFAKKTDLEAFAKKTDLEDMERRLSNKIDAIDEKIDNLEEIDVQNIQERVSMLEKDVRVLKHKHG
ncbi:MAG: hypothetical protein A3I39_01025 [Candidatus Yanofskybacteria bacterium RIFCSPLOWO2_02_FULL_47_9b]|uniref:Uncharacterized protein n=1 Tax=Candidatus Yanofskybacteria bacterium RIFCSPLOWO2_02_FULL_47_9b TaxID=1802708 RepID=A0A1F8H9S7_9BACT|nr:MAG: hypothetical protein A3I39_01025 [Candidatus Yanofskybacteria bacterium RIFCSPLOWO2_02_FULL_47_9b]